MMHIVYDALLFILFYFIFIHGDGDARNKV